MREETEVEWVAMKNRRGKVVPKVVKSQFPAKGMLFCGRKGLYSEHEGSHSCVFIMVMMILMMVTYPIKVYVFVVLTNGVTQREQ